MRHGRVCSEGTGEYQVKSPLLIGSDVRSMNASSLALLTNKELITVQGPLGLQERAPPARTRPHFVWTLVFKLTAVETSVKI